MLTRMLVLWLLSEGPRHGYGITRALTDEAMRFWFPIQEASVYAVLRTLSERGYAEVVKVEREGRRPRRTLYRILREGRRHLQELLVEACRQPPQAADPFHLALAARPEIGEEQFAALLDERRAGLELRLAVLEKLRRSSPAEAIVDRQRALTLAELRWLRSFAKTLDAPEATGRST